MGHAAVSRRDAPPAAGGPSLRSQAQLLLLGEDLLTGIPRDMCPRPRGRTGSPATAGSGNPEVQSSRRNSPTGIARLLDEEGAVVGIVVGSATETDGVYFAVAVQHVREFLPR